MVSMQRPLLWSSAVAKGAKRVRLDKRRVAEKRILLIFGGMPWETSVNLSNERQSWENECVYGL